MDATRLASDSPPSLTVDEVAAIVNDLRLLWKDSDEAPAVRSAAGAFARAFKAKPGFSEGAYWRASGYRMVQEPKVRQEAAAPDPDHAGLLREALDFLANATTDDFGKGADRELRLKLCAALDLNAEDYALGGGR